MFNVWQLKTRFPVGCKVKIIPVENPSMNWAVGKTGTVTNVDLHNEWIGVYFGGHTCYIADESWNEFTVDQIEKI